MDVIKVLEFIRNKGACYNTAHRVRKAALVIKSHLTEYEFVQLSIEISHAELGEVKMFYYVVNELIEKYKFSRK